MPRNNRFVAGDEVLICWASGKATKATVACSPGNNDDGCWYLHDQDGKLFTIGSASTSFHGLWELREEVSNV